MLRAALLALLIALVHLPLMAGAGVYDLPTYALLCEDSRSGPSSRSERRTS